MKELENKRDSLIKKFKSKSKKIDCKNLFGNNELIDLIRKIKDMTHQIENSVECDDCDGDGSIDCDCNCPHCEKEYICDTCGGDGYLSK